MAILRFRLKCGPCSTCELFSLAAENAPQRGAPCIQAESSTRGGGSESGLVPVAGAWGMVMEGVLFIKWPGGQC